MLWKFSNNIQVHVIEKKFFFCILQLASGNKQMKTAVVEEDGEWSLQSLPLEGENKS